MEHVAISSWMHTTLILTALVCVSGESNSRFINDAQGITQGFSLAAPPQASMSPLLSHSQPPRLLMQKGFGMTLGHSGSGWGHITFMFLFGMLFFTGVFGANTVRKSATFEGIAQVGGSLFGLQRAQVLRKKAVVVEEDDGSDVATTSAPPRKAPQSGVLGFQNGIRLRTTTAALIEEEDGAREHSGHSLFGFQRDTKMKKVVASDSDDEQVVPGAQNQPGPEATSKGGSPSLLGFQRDTPTQKVFASNNDDEQAASEARTTPASQATESMKASVLGFQRRVVLKKITAKMEED